MCCNLCVVSKICATDQIFGFNYVSSFTAVNFVLTKFSLAIKFCNESSFAELLQRIYLHGIDFYSRNTITTTHNYNHSTSCANYKSSYTFCAYLITLEDTTVPVREICE